MKNKSIPEINSSPSVDTKTLQSVKIGTQIWATENLNVSKFRNGDPIPEAQSDEEWEKAGIEEKPAWCYYENDPEYGKIYGKLYNWFAVNDPRGIAPSGWHLPNYDDWDILEEFLGSDVAGAKMKSIHGWETEVEDEENDPSGTNESGFSALPGGDRNSTGIFKGIGEDCGWWSSTELDDSPVASLTLFGDHGAVAWDVEPKQTGLYVRCLRD